MSKISSSVKKERKTTLDNLGEALGPPCVEAFRHTIDAANSLEKAHAANYRSMVLEFPKSFWFKTPRERHFRDELWLAANLYRKKKRMIEDEFKARWFVWRALFPISTIIGVQPYHIFGTEECMFVPRSLAIWIAFITGDLAASDIAPVVGRQRTTVLHSIKRAESGVAKKGSEFYNLLTDFLEVESN